MPEVETVRQTARALIVNERGDVLLLAVKLPWLDGPTWTMPGGGIEAGETPEQCARREVAEETGFTYQGELVPGWRTVIEFQHQQQRFEVHEQYFAARVHGRFEPSMASMLEYEKDFSLELRWLSLDELADDALSFSPRHIPEMVQAVHRDDVPRTLKTLTNPMPKNYKPA